MKMPFRLALTLLALAGSVLAQTPQKDPVYLKKRAQRLIEEMNFEFAIRHLEEAIAAFPEDAEMRLLIGECQFELDRLDEAAQSFARGIALSPDLLPRLPHYPLALLRLGRVDEARQIYARLAAQGQDPQAIENGEYGLGLVAMNEGREEEALGHFLRAREYDRDSPKINFRIGTIRMHQGDFAAARDSFLAVVEKDRLHEPALFQLALASHRAGLAEEAARWKKAHEAARRTLVEIDNLKRRLAAKPADPESLAQLAAIWFENGAWDKAAQQYRAVIVSRLEDPEPRYRYAFCLVRLGRIADARPQLDQIVRRWPDHAGARELLAELDRLKQEIEGRPAKEAGK